MLRLLFHSAMWHGNPFPTIARMNNHIIVTKRQDSIRTVIIECAASSVPVQIS